MDRSAPQKSHPSVPPSYTATRSGGRSIFVRRDATSIAEGVGFLEGRPRDASSGEVGGGRSSHPVFVVPEDSAPGAPPPRQVIWKQCRRGGLAARLLRNRYFRLGRFFRELSAHEAARAARIPVSDLLALAITRLPGGGHRVEQLIGFEPECRDAASRLAEVRSRPLERRRLVVDVARAIAAFHDAGLLHGDLNLRNILVGDGKSLTADQRWPVILIDLDPAPPTRTEGLSRAGNVLRLWRSWTRLSRKSELPLPPTDRWRFLRAYFGEDAGAAREFWRVAERAARRGRWLAPEKRGAR